MREPYKYINDKIIGYTILGIPENLEDIDITGSDLNDAIKLAQKDAYNQAINYIVNHDDIDLFHSNGERVDHIYIESLKIK